MAAIIAQITRENRERIRKKDKKNKLHEKCIYEIGPFPERYDPKVRVY